MFLSHNHETILNKLFHENHIVLLSSIKIKGLKAPGRYHPTQPPIDWTFMGKFTTGRAERNLKRISDAHEFHTVLRKTSSRAYMLCYSGNPIEIVIYRGRDFMLNMRVLSAPSWMFLNCCSAIWTIVKVFLMKIFHISDLAIAYDSSQDVDFNFDILLTRMEFLFILFLSPALNVKTIYFLLINLLL